MVEMGDRHRVSVMATHTSGTSKPRRMPRPRNHQEPGPGRSSSGHVEPGEQPLFRLAAALGIAGLVLVLVMEVFLHPSRAHPNDSPAAFREYAASDAFTSIHIGDFIGTLCIVLAFVALYRVLSRQRGWPGAFATVGVVSALLVAAIFAVQMAVDGVALKAAVDAWVNAPPAEAPSAFRVADGIRDMEKGLSGFFQITNGVALLGLGLSIALGRCYPRWLGIVGAVAGIGTLFGGWMTAHTGFSMAASRFSLPTVVLLAVFVVGVCVQMWRDAAIEQRSAGQTVAPTSA
ncbi:MAG TPA: DUF4386 family protein [Actinomycetales bacterium]|nr:DUF4386 family protein [Actinomycetales bacterium]